MILKQLRLGKIANEEKMQVKKEFFFLSKTLPYSFSAKEKEP